MPTSRCPDGERRHTFPLGIGQDPGAAGWVCVCVCMNLKHTHTHIADIDITTQTDTLTRHEQNWTQLENDSKDEGGRGEDTEGKTERTNCFCLHLKTWCANELLKENKSRVMPASSHDSHPALRSPFLPCVHPSLALSLLLTVSDPTPRASWAELSVWMSRREGWDKVLVCAALTVCAKT